MSKTRPKMASSGAGGMVTSERKAPPRTGERAPGGSRIGFFLLPSFALMSFASALEALRAANRMSGRDLYDWQLISRDGNPVACSSGIEVSVHAAMADVERLDRLLVVAGFGGEDFRDERAFAWMRRLGRTGCAVGALSLGGYVLARAGMLDGYRCTVHWENLEAFREEFPHLDATSEVYEIDRGRMTCSGGTGALDLMLALVGQDHGRALAVKVAEQFIHERIRDSRDPQRMTLRSRLGVAHPKVLEAVGLMEAHVDEVLSRAELAARIGVSARQLERLFQRYLGCTPTRYYLTLRLERARRLLQQTPLPIIEIALACGFVSASHFSKAYRDHFAKTPRQERAVVR